MIVWSGWGILILVFGAVAAFGDIALVSALSGTLSDGAADTVPLTARIAGFLPWIGAAAAAWFMGRKVNTKTEQVLINPETNEPVVIRRGGGHSLFFIPMQYWAFILLIVGAFAFVEMADPAFLSS
ncbi:MAG: hypothetical protein R3C08_05220 [Hyphomonas sp.]|nr:hypothetical protein [Hyphomonas sp.]HRX73335.1 hypothetical protein [Hyphomonas sp.]